MACKNTTYRTIRTMLAVKLAEEEEENAFAQMRYSCAIDVRGRRWVTHEYTLIETSATKSTISKTGDEMFAMTPRNDLPWRGCSGSTC